MNRYEVKITVTEIKFDGNMEIPVPIHNEDVIFSVPDSIDWKFREFCSKLLIHFLKKAEKIVKKIDKRKKKEGIEASFSEHLLNEHSLKGVQNE